MYTTFFVFTAAMLIMAMFRMVPAMFSNGVNLPSMLPMVDLTPVHAIILYPSTMFQVYFWAERLMVIS